MLSSPLLQDGECSQSLSAEGIIRQPGAQVETVVAVTVGCFGSSLLEPEGFYLIAASKCNYFDCVGDSS